MEIKAKVKYLRMSTKKLRQAAGLVRGLSVGKAIDQLSFSPRKASLPVIKLIKSAIASAEHNFELDKNNLFVKEIRIDEGGMLHRWTPKAHGRATPIRKKISHIILTLAEIKDSGVKAAKKQEIESPISLEEMSKKGEISETKEEKNKEAKEAAKKSATTASGTGKKGFVSKMFNRKSGGK